MVAQRAPAHYNPRIAMGKESKQREPAYLRSRGLYVRSVSALLVFQGIGWGCAAGLAYLILSPELAKDYFSAHRTVKATWQLVVPALAVSAGVGFLLVGLGSALSVWSYSRRLLEPLRRIDRLIRDLAEGRIPRPAPAEKTPDVEHEVAAVLGPLRAHVEDIRRISREMQKISLELNYRSAATTAVTLKDLRVLADKVDALSKELTRTSGFFEG
ncbi:MAG: hypothetical protein ACYC9Y_16160 [Candidatus Methylomirabilia bacterium]